MMLENKTDYYAMTEEESFFFNSNNKKFSFFNF